MSGNTILIVDDEIIIARELEARLRNMGYQVPAIAASGPEAIANAERHRPELVLMDIVLKGEMDGIEAATEIRRRFQTPVIYLTAYTDDKTLKRAMITEPFGYIVKPFSERELRANIEMALYKHQVEKRLRKMEHWFSHTVDVMGDAVVAADTDGRITVFNQAAEAITAWPRAEAVGKPLHEIVRIVDRASGAAIEVHGSNNGPIVHLANDTLLLDRGGRSIPVDFTTSSMRDSKDVTTGIVSVMRDALGQRRGALAALNSDVAQAAAQCETLREMLKNCAQALVHHLNALVARIWTMGPRKDVLVLQANAGLHTNGEGANSRIAVGKDRVGQIAQNREPYLTNTIGGDASIADPVWAKKEGIVAFAGYPLVVGSELLGVMALFARQRLSDSVLSALESVAGTVAVGVERKRLEAQLHQSQKMEAVGQLAGGVAHDFNNLLTVISGCNQLLGASANLSAEDKGLVSAIAEASDRAASLTRQLLAFSRKQVLDPVVLDLNEIVTDMKKMLERLIGEDIRLSTSLEPKLDRITADRGQLEQVLANLAVNARDAMPQGGQLTIETHNLELDESFLRLHRELTNSRVVMLAMTDTGEGMSPEVAAHAFEPFFTTKAAGKGTGLGLSTVYGIVRQSGGHVSIYSEVGIGTTFKIYLPTTAQAAIVRRVEPAVRELPRGTETILLAEDEAAVRALVSRALRASGYCVLEAQDGLEAVRIAGEFGGVIDLVITDVVMPELAGRLLSERLAELRPDIKVLYMSGYTDDAIIRHGVLERGAAFLQKPFTPDTLAMKVRAILDGPPSAAP